MIQSSALRIKSGAVFTGKDHASIFMQKPKGFFYDAEQGFVTESGRFVDRKTAYKIALENDQIVHKHGKTDELFSEDLIKIKTPICIYKTTDGYCDLHSDGIEFREPCVEEPCDDESF